MKKLALALGVAVALVSCNENRGIAVKPKLTIQTNQGPAYDIELKIIKLQGHEYIVMDGYKQGGICHSESCPCKSK